MSKKKKAPRKRRMTPTKRRVHPLKKAIPYAPLAVGAMAAGGTYFHDKKKADGIQKEIDSIVDEHNSGTTAKALNLGVKALRDPEILQEALKMRQDGEITQAERMELGLKIVSRESGVMTDMLTTSFSATLRVNRLREELNQVEENIMPRATDAFIYPTSGLYLLMALVVAHQKIRASISNRKTKDVKRTKIQNFCSHCNENGVRNYNTIKNPQKREDKKDPSPIIIQNPKKPITKINPSETLPHETTRADYEKRTQKEFMGIVANTKRKRKRPKNKKIKGPKILSVTTQEMLKQKGFNPFKVEKALISAFKILSPTQIYVAMRYAQTPDVMNGLKKKLGNKKGKEFFDLLKTEGAIQFHKGEDCVSLEPKPQGELGKTLMKDVGSKVVDMQRNS
jgi:hypothetical protein